jgi:hypothetical protein
MNRKKSVRSYTKSQKVWAVRFYLVAYFAFVLTLLAPISPTQNPYHKLDEAKAEQIRTMETPKETAFRIAETKYGWGRTEQKCLGVMWGKESAWRYKAKSPTHDYGIPQRHMSHNTQEEIDRFLENPTGQIEWGLNYIRVRYDSPCKAWEFWQKRKWY